jgi:hypothetical protein
LFHVDFVGIKINFILNDLTITTAKSAVPNEAGAVWAPQFASHVTLPTAAAHAPF